MEQPQPPVHRSCRRTRTRVGQHQSRNVPSMLLGAILCLLVFASESAIGRALALEITTPTDVAQCVNTTVEWSEGVEPYILFSVPAVLTPLDTVHFYVGITGESFIWTPSYDVDALVRLCVNDSASAGACTNFFLITGSNDNSCLGTQTSSSADPPPPSASPDFTHSATRSSLSTGAIVGIVIACVVVVSAVAVWFVRKRRIQAFRKRHRAMRSNWQVLSDMPSAGAGTPYPFGGGEAQAGNRDQGTMMYPPPSPSVQRPNQVAGSIASRRAPPDPMSP